MDTIEYTRDLLKNRPRSETYSKIENETGIKESWLRAFSCGNINNPSFRTVQKLIKYLSGNDIKVSE